MSTKNIENSYANHGLAIILGTKYGFDNSKFTKIEHAINNNTALNIMLTEFDEQGFNQDDLTSTLRAFMSKNPKTTVIIAIHGSEVIYGSDHYSIVGKALDNSLLFNFIDGSVVNFLYGNVLRSSRILEAIGNAAKEKTGTELNVWQYTCQGSKLIDYAQKYLPIGTTYVAESKGFISSKFFLNTIFQELKANHEFSFDELYKNYLAMSAKFPYAYRSMEPVKFVIGEKPIKSIEKADQLVEEIRADSVNKDKFEKAINIHCQKVEQAKPEIIHDNLRNYFAKTPDDLFCTYGTKNIIKAITESPKNSSYTACVDTSDHGSFIGYYIDEFIDYVKSFFWDMNNYQLPTDCITKYYSGLVGGDIEDLQSIAEHYYS